MKKAPKNHPSFYSFKDTKDFEKFLQNKDWKSGELDYITLSGSVYTMHEYDLHGQSITWANKRLGQIIEVNTSNRYKNGYSDAEVFCYLSDYMRDDIAYHD